MVYLMPGQARLALGCSSAVCFSLLINGRFRLTRVGRGTGIGGSASVCTEILITLVFHAGGGVGQELWHWCKQLD